MSVILNTFKYNSMKYYLLFSMLILSIDCFCQNETIPLEFYEMDPIWEHVLVDSTFEEPAPGSNFISEYVSLSIRDFVRIEDEVYILSSSDPNTKIGDDYGFVLDKIDFESGELIWKHHNTKYNNGNQDFYHWITPRLDGDVELIGVDRYKPDSTSTLSWRLGGLNSLSTRKIIDSHTGELRESFTAKDSIYRSSFPCRHFKQFALEEDSLYLTAFMIGKNSATGNGYDYGVDYYLMDHEMNKIDESRHLFYDTLGPFSINQPSFLNRLNENTLVSIAYKDRLDSWNNNGLKMMWTDISDPYNIKNIRSIDYSDIVPGSKESFVTLSFKTLGNTIYLGHYYPNFDIQDGAAYILWLNEDGSIKTFIDLPYYNDHLYQYTNMVYANDQFAYLLAFPSSSGRVGFDIIRIVDGRDSVEFVSSITAKNEGESFGPYTNEVYEDGYMLFSGLVSRDGQAIKTSTKMFCFNTDDLGMSFDPLDTDELVNSLNVKVYPNPTSNAIHFTNLDDDLFEYMVYDNLGMLVDDGILNSSTLSLAHLPTGQYIIRIKGNTGIFTTKIIKI